jgi:undecaprenyl-diphosphatase
MSPRSDPSIGLAVGGIAVVVLLAIAVGAGVTDAIDRPIIELVRGEALHGLLSPLRLATELGSTAAVSLVAVLVLLVGVVLRRRRAGLLGALTILLASIGNTLLKITIARNRPDLLDPVVVEHGFSFPSGHSALSMVAYGVVAVLVARSSLPIGIRRAVVIALGAVVFLVGLSRIWLGVHYPTDVVAGWTAGAVVVLLYAAATRPVSTGPVAAAAAADPAGPRSDRPAPG